jgi:hypothetical protein
MVDQILKGAVVLFTSTSQTFLNVISNLSYLSDVFLQTKGIVP